MKMFSAASCLIILVLENVVHEANTESNKLSKKQQIDVIETSIDKELTLEKRENTYIKDMQEQIENFQILYDRTEANHVKKDTDASLSIDADKTNNDQIIDKVYKEEANNKKKDDIELLKHNTEAEKKVYYRRTIRRGDILTPIELLPIAKRLILQVDDFKPGSGKGFVSSVSNPQALADKLFEALFLTHKRFVTIKEIDIDALNALQALALNGEVADNTYIESDKVNPEDEDPYRCKYRLITKKDHKTVVKSNTEDKGEPGHKRLKAANKIKVKRNKLKSNKDENIMKNKGASKSTNEDHDKTAIADSKNYIDRQKIFTPVSSYTSIPRNPLCRFKYKCIQAHFLKSCGLRQECRKNPPSTPFPNKSEKYVRYEHNQDMDHQFRRMFGLSLVDEDVEKIVEVHVLLSNRRFKYDKSEEIEGVQQYFNRLMIMEHFETTTPVISTSDEDNIKSNKSFQDDDHKTNKKHSLWEPKHEDNNKKYKMTTRFSYKST